MILLDSILGKGNYFRLDLQLLILYIALAVFNGVLAAIAFSQLVRIHMRNQQIGWTRQKLYFQIEQAMRSESIRLKLLVDLFHEIVQEPFFDQLRTKEQLGYVVLCGWTHK